MVVYLLTTGDGSDGSEWNLESIHKTEDGAKEAKSKYERRRYRPNGTWYTLDADIEEWDVES